MYKRLTVSQIKDIKCGFFPRFHKIYSREGYPTALSFLKKAFKEGSTLYYFEGGDPSFKMSLIGPDSYILADEKEKIECEVAGEDLTILHNYCKKLSLPGSHKNLPKQSISATLETKFMEGAYPLIEGKPYLVYDIETLYRKGRLHNQEFFMAYVIDSSNRQYKYVWPEALSKFVDHLLNFDGYVVGYNNIRFDNPVCLDSDDRSPEFVQSINEKSIDVFLFLSNLLKRRLKLTVVAEDLVGIGKTLDSGLQAQTMYEEYLKTWNKEILDRVKRYCKNDVKMTLLVLLYFLEYQSFNFEDKQYDYTIDQMVELSRFAEQTEEEKNGSGNQSIFGG